MTLIANAENIWPIDKRWYSMVKAEKRVTDGKHWEGSDGKQWQDAEDRWQARRKVGAFD